MSYTSSQPERSAVDALPGLVALDFGTDWCGYCRAGEPVIANALKDYPDAQHIQVEDGPGRPLGRSFKVKLWPTVVVLKDGVEVARVTRPDTSDEVRDALSKAVSA
ncbi:thioredoxin family protein [Massilia sp. CMS3.1]|uniref:thioredoxin family protein n=1 Tax=Massilia sp. CMS3.1 TaxID=3373083 RepID=UPI003EE6A506